ncbi:hypothetical protein [Sphingobacterium faecale]|uniref:Uncharacterized protein n=1 Tax=Sphingobacterium faecale TaxID=2803775 RepID=A0ABS1R3J7_9SPHI|nr:hypothetical protein [Sphingobacterium faecale]MBL1409233.1 hypothetical protein [Sphingobacterium faecale]
MKHFFRDGRGMAVSQSRVRLLADDKDLFSSPIEPNEGRLSTMSPSGLLHFVRNDEWEGTHTWGILRRYTKRASAGVAGWFGMASGPSRTMVHTCSTVVRVLFGCCSSATRSSLEAESKDSRRALEELSKASRTASEGVSKRRVPELRLN